MKTLLEKIWQTGIVGTFLAGMFVLLPIALTVMILDWLVGKIVAIIGPGTLLGDLMLTGGGSIVGPNHAVLAFVIGLVIALALIWILGIIVKSQARQQIPAGIDGLMSRFPVVRSVYKPVAQVVRLFADRGDNDIKAMRVVSCRLGDTDLLGLVTSDRRFMMGDQSKRLVYLPTSPVPMTGGLILVSAECITFLPDLSVDELMQIYLSLGVVIPDTFAGWT
ncbi:MAG: putative membrane protein [Sulfitobacter sp.]|jgi:uncharacterized membrane protein